MVNLININMFFKLPEHIVLQPNFIVSFTSMLESRSWQFFAEYEVVDIQRC